MWDKINDVPKQHRVLRACCRVLLNRAISQMEHTMPASVVATLLGRPLRCVNICAGSIG
jgi:hypothetical protein